MVGVAQALACKPLPLPCHPDGITEVRVLHATRDRVPTEQGASCGDKCMSQSVLSSMCQLFAISVPTAGETEVQREDTS